MAEEIITSTNADTATDHEYNASEIQVMMRNKMNQMTLRDPDGRRRWYCGS